MNLLILIGAVAVLAIIPVYIRARRRRKLEALIKSSRTIFDRRTGLPLEYYQKDVEPAIVSRLACGAVVIHLDSFNEHYFFGLVEEGKSHFLREGNFIVLCIDKCALRCCCPLIKDYIQIQDIRSMEKHCRRIIGDDYLADVERNLPVVGDGNPQIEALRSVALHFKGYLVGSHGSPGLIVAPMLLEMNDGNDSRNRHGDI